MGSSTTERLSQAETRLLQAAGTGGHALAAFSDDLANLLNDIEHEVQSKEADEETMATWSGTALRLARLSEQLIEYREAAEVLVTTLQAEVESMFSGVNLNDTTGGRLPQSDSTHLSRRSHSPALNPHDHLKETPGNPPYIESAYFWLLDNLHNPYPSKETKESIAQTTTSDIKAVDSWFVDARKRVGWNDLRRQQFSNKRVEIVDAATRFFLRPDEKRPLDVNIEVKLAAVEKAARDLYSNRFTESTLALKLDAAVQDLTPETKTRAKEAEQLRRERDANELKQDALAAASYPSPAHSPRRVSSPLGSSPASEEDPLPTEKIAGQKRRRSSEDLTLGNKRTRYDTTISTTSIGLPSPAPSTHETLEIVSDILPSSLEDMANPSISSSRKRRLSESDGQGAPKRPRNLPVGPRLHAVSDPLPMSVAPLEATDMDDWFQSNFGLPNIAQVDALDASFPLDVEVFDYSTLGFTSDLFTPIPPIQSLEHSPSGWPNNTIPPSSVDSSPQVNQLVNSSKDIDYNLFCDYPEVNSSSTIVPDIMHATTLEPSALNFTSQKVTYFGTQPTISDLDFFYQTSQDDSQRIAEISPHFHSSTFFDASSMTNNSLDTSLDGLLVQANKAAKQKMLQEMKEAARRLEEEIAASS